MNAYSGGTGAVLTAVARAPHASSTAQTPSTAPSVSASGFSWLTTSALRAAVSRARTAAGTASRASASSETAAWSTVIDASADGGATWRVRRASHASHPDHGVATGGEQ